MTLNEPDGQLVLAARGGDKAAFGTLLIRHRPLLLAICRRALNDDALADDAAQEASLQALLSLDRLRQPERFGSWLAGIGLNVCRRMMRQRRRETWSWEAMLGGQRLREPIDPLPGPEAVAATAELRAWIDRAVAGLPPGQRAAVILHYLAGLTQAETAALLGVETGAIKTRLHKARATLRRELWQALELTPASESGGRAMVEMRVADVRQRRADEGQTVRHFVVLEEVEGPGRLPIWLGEPESTALALHLESVSFPRPQTYAFAAEVLRAVGGQLREVRIDRLVDDVFYATAVVTGSAGEREVDARPSDALNLALLLGAPIRVDTGVLEACREPSVDEWTRQDELTDGAAVIAAQVTERWNEHAKKQDPIDEGG